MTKLFHYASIEDWLETLAVPWLRYARRHTATHRPDSKDEEDWYVSERAIPRGHWMRTDDTESGALVWEAS